MKHGAETTKITSTRGSSTIFTAFERGHNDILEYLLQQEYDQIGDNMKWFEDLWDKPSIFPLLMSTSNIKCWATLFWWGLFQCKSATNMEVAFYVAAKSGTTFLAKWMTEIYPWLLETYWLVKEKIPSNLAQYEAFTATLIVASKQVPRLDILCRAKIFKLLGLNPMQKAEKLRMPRLLRDFVQLKDVEGLCSTE